MAAEVTWDDRVDANDPTQTLYVVSWNPENYQKAHVLSGNDAVESLRVFVGGGVSTLGGADLERVANFIRTSPRLKRLLIGQVSTSLASPEVRHALVCLFQAAAANSRLVEVAWQTPPWSVASIHGLLAQAATCVTHLELSGADFEVSTDIELENFTSAIVANTHLQSITTDLQHPAGTEQAILLRTLSSVRLPNFKRLEIHASRDDTFWLPSLRSFLAAPNCSVEKLVLQLARWDRVMMIDALTDGLVQNQSITTLCIYEGQAADERIVNGDALIARIFQRKADFQKCNLGFDESQHESLSILQHSRSLTVLEILGGNYSDGEILRNILMNNQQLTTLEWDDLYQEIERHDDIDDDDEADAEWIEWSAQLCLGLQVNRTLTSLTIGNSLDARSMSRHIFSALVSNPHSSLSYLDISGKVLGSGAVACLCNRLRCDFCPLTSLIMEDCPVTQDNVMAILSALEQNSTLESLNILHMRGYCFNHDGIMALSVLLPAIKFLREISLSIYSHRTRMQLHDPPDLPHDEPKEIPPALIETIYRGLNMNKSLFECNVHFDRRLPDDARSFFTTVAFYGIRNRTQGMLQSEQSEDICMQNVVGTILDSHAWWSPRGSPTQSLTPFGMSFMYFCLRQRIDLLPLLQQALRGASLKEEHE